MQDIATGTLTETDAGARATFAPAEHDRGTTLPELRDRLRVLVLGIQVWVIGVGWPLMSANREIGAIELGAGLLCLLALVLGVWVSGRKRRRGLQLGLWLGVFPAALGAACAARPERWNQQHYRTAPFLLLWLSLCAYGAFAARVGAGPVARIAGASLPLPVEAGAARSSARGRLWQRSWVGLCFAGAIAIALIAPAGNFAQLERDWGSAAPAGGVLTAIVGGALGVATLAVFLSQGLRELPARPSPTGRERLSRVALCLLLAVLGLITYRVVIPG